MKISLPFALVLVGLQGESVLGRLPAFWGRTNKNVAAKSPSSSSPPPLETSPLTDYSAESESTTSSSATTTRTSNKSPLSFAPLYKSLSTLWATLQGINPRFIQWTMNGAQLGLIVYLGVALYQSATEAWQEVLGELENDTSTNTYNDPLLVTSPERLQAVIAHLKHENNQQQSPLQLDGSLLQLARQLRSSGLPLTSSHTREVTSVQSILQSLTVQEARLLQECLYTPPTAALSLEQIAGLPQQIQQSLMDQIRQHAHDHDDDDTSTSPNSNHAFASLFPSDSSTTTPTGGILLYGPPGCGKTLLLRTMAQALARPTLVLTPSLFLRKYVGETNARLNRLFQRLLPKLSSNGENGGVVLILDELDGLFQERGGQDDHSVHRDFKTEFLQWWDGILSDHSNKNKILVLAATNRPFDVDPAVLRRLPQKYAIGLPSAAERYQLLQHLLQHVPVCQNLDWKRLAVATEGYSPSDLHHVLQTAALQLMRKTQNKKDFFCTGDILSVLPTVPPTSMSPQYRQALQQFAGQALPVEQQLQQQQQQQQQPSFQQQQPYHEESNPFPQEFQFYDAGTVELKADDDEILDGRTDHETEFQEESEMTDDDDL